MRSFIIAHRGASCHAPENTRSAFLAAAELGADGIETDVQRTGDGKLVVQHNYIIDGCSNGSGMISNLRLDELKALDFGADRDGEWHSESILTLDECLDTVADFAMVDLELKAPIESPDSFAQDVADAVVAHGMQNRVVISAFNHNLLREVKRRCPGIRVGILIMPAVFTKNRLFTLLLDYLPKGRRLIDVTREDLANLPEEALRNMEIGIRSADATGAIVELARQIGAVYPNDTIHKFAASLEAQRDVLSYAERLDFKPDFLHCHYSAVLANPELVERLAQKGIGCNPWTPDDPNDLKQLSILGCTGIITNRPDLLLEIQRQGGQFDE